MFQGCTPLLVWMTVASLTAGEVMLCADIQAGAAPLPAAVVTGQPAEQRPAERAPVLVNQAPLSPLFHRSEDEDAPGLRGNHLRQAAALPVRAVPAALFRDALRCRFLSSDRPTLPLPALHLRI